jgi:hypothetical protein
MLPLESAEDCREEMRKVVWCAGGDEVPVNYDRLIDPLSPSGDKVIADRAVRGETATSDDPR